MILQPLRKNEKPSIFVPVGVGFLTILTILLIVLSVLIFDRNRQIQNQQTHIVTLLNNLNANQQRLEVLYTETPSERAAKLPKGKIAVPRDEYNKFKKEYIREMKRLRKQIQNLKALL